MLPWQVDDEVFLDWGQYKEIGWVAREHGPGEALHLRLAGSVTRRYVFHPHEERAGHYRAENGQPVQIWLRSRASASNDGPTEAA